MDQVYGEEQICTMPYSVDAYQTNEFDGVEYIYEKYINFRVAVEQFDVPLQGNRKDIRISQFDTNGTNKLFWR